MAIIVNSAGGISNEYLIDILKGYLPVDGIASAAKKLETGRTIKVDLDSASAATFDGSKNITPGVEGILGVDNGGTGANAIMGRSGVVNKLFPSAITPGFIPAFTSGWAETGYVTVSNLRKALGFGTGDGALGLSYGGTGGTNRTEAWDNIVAGGGTLTGSITIDASSSSTSERGINVYAGNLARVRVESNKSDCVGLSSGSGGKAGLYNYGTDSWMIYSERGDGNIFLRSYHIEVWSDGTIAFYKNTSSDFDMVIKSSDMGIETSGEINAGKLVSSTSKIQCLPSYSTAVSYAQNVYISTSGTFSRTTNTSSKKLKRDVVPLMSKPKTMSISLFSKENESIDKDISAECLYDLEVMQFKYNDGVLTEEGDIRINKNLPGFIIEDMIEVYPIAVDKNDPDDIKTWSWNPQYLIPPMLKLIQDQKKDIDKLKEQLTKLS